MFSRDIELTDEHMDILEKHAPKFKAAKVERREKIIKKVASQIKKAWPEDMGFDKDRVVAVSDLSGKLHHSQIFSAYPQAPVWQI